MRSQTEKTDETSPTEINSQYNEFLTFIKKHPQYDVIVRPFCNHIDKILNAWTKAGVTETMLLRDITCVKQVLENPNLENIVHLYEQSKIHDNACQTKIKVGASEVAGGSIFSAGLYTGLSALSLFNPAITVGLAATTAAASGIAGIVTAFDSTKKSGMFSQILRDIIKNVMGELLNNHDYKTYAAAVIGQEKINAQYRGSSENCIEDLENCIGELKKLNGSKLYDICIKLNSAYFNLNGNHQNSLKTLENLINSLCEKMLEQENYKDFSLIKIKLILRRANCRKQDDDRENNLVTLINKISHVENAKDSSEIRNQIETIISKLNNESKNKNYIGLETSQCAKDLKKMVLDKLPVSTNKPTITITSKFSKHSS